MLLIEDCCIHIITIKLVRWLSVMTQAITLLFFHRRGKRRGSGRLCRAYQMGARGFARLLLILGSRRFGKFNLRERLLGGVYPKLQNRAPYRRHRPNVETSTLFFKYRLPLPNRSGNGRYDGNEELRLDKLSFFFFRLD